MRTIQQITTEILGRSPFLGAAISEGVANNAKIARLIKPDIENILLEEVSDEAVTMAVHRAAKDLQRPQFGTKFLKLLSDITVRSKLIEYTFPNTVDISSVVAAIVNIADMKKDAFFNFSRGLHESLIIVSRELENDLIAALGNARGVRKSGELSAITLRLPEESLSVPGVYYPILKALAFEGISFTEVMSVRTELSILFEEKDIDRAFAVIKKITA